MSAFIVSKATMDGVVSAIKNVGIFKDTDRIGRELYVMNLAAVALRYPRVDKTSAPGPQDISNIFDDYKYTDTGMSPMNNLKALRCFLYQCAEGDIPKLNLFQELHVLAGNLAMDIVAETQEYKEAMWDD